MRILFLISVLVSFNDISQNWQTLTPRLDSTSGKFGFVDSTGSFIIKPTYDEARDFASEYTSVRVDTLWGIIDNNGTYILKPKFDRISVVYRKHFLESGENMKFRSIKGNVLYEYLFIPGPFDQMKDFKSDPEVAAMKDFQLILRVLEMYGRICHYYQMNRILNWIAIETQKYGIMTIDFVLDNPKRVRTWIKNDKEYEVAFEKGKIECCGNGTYWWGE